jgi:hypothetical protein
VVRTRIGAEIREFRWDEEARWSVSRLELKRGGSMAGVSAVCSEVVGERYVTYKSCLILRLRHVCM